MLVQIPFDYAQGDSQTERSRRLVFLTNDIDFLLIISYFFNSAGEGREGGFLIHRTNNMRQRFAQLKMPRAFSPFIQFNFTAIF